MKTVTTSSRSLLDRDAFEHLRERDDLLEWAEVHGNYYGTPRSPVEKCWGAG
jgi:guanylate kinase